MSLIGLLLLFLTFSGKLNITGSFRDSWAEDNEHRRYAPRQKSLPNNDDQGYCNNSMHENDSITTDVWVAVTWV